MKILATNIKYDTDGQYVSLPKRMVVDVLDNDDCTAIADAISDKTGFCVIDFDYREVRT